MSERIIQTAHLDQLTAGDPAFRKELITTCLDMFGSFKIDFRKAISSRDVPEARFLAHKIKANLSMLEADFVYINLSFIIDIVERGGITDPELVALLTDAEGQITAIDGQLKAALAED